MEERTLRKIVLEDGTEYYGKGFGADCDKVAEIVFNTSMVGYQEILTDPANTDIMMVMTYPLIGNYGITNEDDEAKNLSLAALVVSERCDTPSNFRATKTLSETLEDYGVPGIYGIDTRKLTRQIRDKGSMKAMITWANMPKEKALEIIATTEILTNSVQNVSCKKKWYSRTANHKYDVVAIDCGITKSTIKILNKIGCNVTIMPYDTTAEEVLALRPDGLFISNGPGNPAEVKEVIGLVKNLKGKLAILGVGLGHEIIALAYGAKVEKLKFGHHGSNHSVKNINNGKINIQAQNHNYVVDKASAEKCGLEVTAVNVLDGTTEEIADTKNLVLGAQYTPNKPENNNDINNIYLQFSKNMEVSKNA